MLASALFFVFSAARAQSAAALRALELEQGDRYRDAAAAYREVLGVSPTDVQAILGLERVYAQLGLTDSLLPHAEAAIAARPREAVFRVVLLRSFHSLGRRDKARVAFERWRADWPRDPVPYREYARLLIQESQIVAADSVLRRAQAEFGGARGLEHEIAQLRAATGLWELSADAWRAAVRESPYLGQAAIHSLLPTPEGSRAAVRASLAAPPVEAGARRILAGLELSWGGARDAWAALSVLNADSAGTAAWLEFANRAEEADAWIAARDALVALHERSRSPELAARAAADALNGGDPASALALASGAEVMMDSVAAASSVLPTKLRALATLGRAEEAHRVFSAYHPRLTREQRTRVGQLLAWAWVRAGDVAKARTLLADSASGAGNSDVEGWLALYDGDLRTARRKLKGTQESTPELVTALAFLARTKADSALSVGHAFLALARGDSARAATALEASAPSHAEASSLLLSIAARLHAARRFDVRAMAIWKQIAEGYPQSPEAPEAFLEWARALRRANDPAAAIVRLEHMILTYSQSALVPQARRELELARATVPPNS